MLTLCETLGHRIEGRLHDDLGVQKMAGTCKLNRIEPYAYPKNVLHRLPSHPVNCLAELLPFNWKPVTS